MQSLLVSARRMLMGPLASPYELSLLDWSQSICWALLGVVSVGTCASSTNKRIKAEYERLQLQEQKNKLLTDLCRLQQQAAQQQQQLAQVKSVLQEHAAHSRWWQPWIPLQDRLLTVLER